jgi:hypothetical protein
MKRLRVEPISTYLERRRKGPIYPVIVASGFVYLSGLPPFDPNRRHQAAVIRPAGRNRARTNEVMPRSGRFFAGTGGQM